MTEELESIPWSTLIEETKADRAKFIYMAAGALILFAVAALGARALWGASGDGGGVPGDIGASAPAPPATTSTTMTDPLLSEADLMAALDNESGRAAAAFAEWFVYDYFTVDGDPATLLAVQAALPSGVPEQLLSHTDPAVVTWVEWARTARVTELTPGTFEVLVLFRTVASQDGSAFTRQPVKAVLVPMVMSAGGGLRLTDLPSTAPIPQRPDVPPWTEPTGSFSPEVAGAAIGLSWTGVATDHEIIGAERAGDGWRVLVRNHLPAGAGWPFVVSFPDEWLRDG